MALVAALILLGVGLYFAIPWLADYYNHVSTDDAYVAGYVTYMGPRIASRVERVAVREDDAIRAGELLVQLDPQPFRLAVEEAQAKLQFAQANLAQTLAEVRAQLATIRARQYLAESAADQLQYRIATLKSGVAELKLDQAQLVLAERNQTRNTRLLDLKVISQEDYDQSNAALQVARNKVGSQSEIVQRMRAELGISRNTANPTEVPDDIAHHYSPLQVALSNWATSLSQVGVPLNVAGLSSAVLHKELDKWLADQIPEKTVAKIVEDAPMVQVTARSASSACWRLMA